MSHNSVSRNPDSKSRSEGKALVYFASADVNRPDSDATLPAKLGRMLKKFDLARLCQKAHVPIKMHLGGDLGYSTIHPVFVRTVVEAVKAAGGKPFIIDGSYEAVSSAAARGYTTETMGCPIVAAGGPYNSHVVRRNIGYRTLKSVSVFGAIWDAPCLINFSHVKGHGACAYAGACKNIAMGCVDGASRSRIHELEGGIEWVRERCALCGRCVKTCDTGAIELDAGKKEVCIFFHHCRYCRHCVAACPHKALVVREKDGFKHFQEGMARVTRSVLESFDPSRVLHINLLTQITMFCDCWGMTTPSIVPDIGVMASHDIVAVETASLRAIKTRNFIPGSLIGGRTFVCGKHLLEKIHGKDPFIQIRALERHGLGRSDFALIQVE